MNRIKSIKSLAAKGLVLPVLCAACVMTGVVFSPGTASAYVAPEKPASGNYFTPDYQSKDEAMQAADDLNEQICEEGFTLLKNEDNALPLGEGAKVSVFGKSSSELLYGLSSNYVHLRGNMTTLQESLQSAGFSVNPALVNFYASSTASGKGRGSQPTNGTRTFGYNTGETPVSMYTDELEETYSEYNDAAIVVFSRSSGEGWDMPRTMEWDGKSYTSGGRGQKVPGARNMDDHYLQLDQNETDLLAYLNGKFSKVIVLLNTPSQFETGFLDDPGHYAYQSNIKAALWLGYFGKTGINALGRILKGEVNPSGRTVDTWSRDFKLEPTWNNFSDNRVPGGNQYSNISSWAANKYVIYKEGIYVGYRYWETRGYTEGLNVPYNTAESGETIHGTTTSEWNDWYDAHVVYPFGHGLSYTTFTQEIISSSLEEGAAIDENTELEFTVRVTNTGSTYAGKDTVLMFYTAPYDETSETAIEKAHVVLGGFAKTDIIQPGGFQDVTVTIPVRDMASYDYSDANGNGIKGYELEAGDYQIKLMRDAHTLIETVQYKVENDIYVRNDAATGNAVENRFDEVSNYLTDTLGEKYMSRRDFEGTFPKANTNLAASQEVIDGVAKWSPGHTPDISGEDWYVPEGEEPTFGDDTGDIVLSDLFGADYNDELWDEFLDQISFDTALQIAGSGSYRSGIEVPDLGIPRVINAGQPAGYMSLFSGMEGAIYAFFASDVVTASTFNTQLAYEKGLAIGNEALFGTGVGKSRFPGWYAPAADTHRSPFGGRNADYYSEDGMLAGKMASGIIKGAMEKGVFCFMKHFALNEQEVDRVGVNTWANEQAMREIYFKPFELGVKEGGTVGIMSAMNRLGTTWTGGNRALLTDVLRNEWGFEGAVVTDSYLSNVDYFDQMLLAGGDLALGYAVGESSKIDTATEKVALRNAVHNILYMMASSMAMNTGYATPPEMLNEYSGSILPVGSVDVEYFADIGTVTFNADAFEDQPVPDESQIVYALKEGSTLPEGLTLSSDGVISGTPSQEVTGATFTVTATYSTCVKEATFSINISSSNGSVIFGEQGDMPRATIGKDYSFKIEAEIYKYGATPEEIAAFPPVTFALANGSALPEGLTLASDGTISGVPLKECTDYSFTVTAGAIGFSEVRKTFTISVGFEITYEGATLSNGRINNSYIANVNTAECANDVTYALKEGSTLPAGLTLTPGGTIVGTPTQTVSGHTFTVVASSDFCQPVEAQFTISVGLAFNDFDLADGTEGSAYYSSVAMAQGAGNIVYSVKEGALPEGLTLSSDGVISGTPSKAGVYNFTVSATAEGLEGDEIEVMLYVANAEGGSVDVGGTEDNTGAIIAISVTAGAVVVCAVVGSVIYVVRKKSGKNKQ